MFPFDSVRVFADFEGRPAVVVKGRSGAETGFVLNSGESDWRNVAAIEVLASAEALSKERFLEFFASSEIPDLPEPWG